MNQDAIGNGNLDDITLTVNTGATVDNSTMPAVSNNSTILLDDDAEVTSAGSVDFKFNGVAEDGQAAIRVDNDSDVTIQAGGTVTSENHGIRVDNDGKVTIEGAELDPVTGDVLVPAGSVSADNDAIKLRNGSELDNAGSIFAKDKGVDSEGFENVTITNSGSIEADDKAIRAGADGADGGDNLILTNSGSIVSKGDEGVETGNDATIVNTGTIKGFDDAVQVGTGAMITNEGLIENTATAADVLADPDAAQDAIDLDSGTITNTASGQIISTVDAAIDFDPTTEASKIENRGVIRGTLAVETAKAEGSDPADAGQQTIDNWGVLEGTSGLALDLGLGDDALNMKLGGTLIGGAQFGGGLDSLSFASDFVFDMDFAGGSLLDGGAGFDTIFFDNLLLSDLTVKSFAGDTVELLVFDTHLLNFKSWESFTFSDDTRVTFNQLDPVPLPAGVVLLGSGIAVFAVARRRQRAAAA